MTKKALQEGFEKKFGKYKSQERTRKLQRGWTNIRIIEDEDDMFDLDDGSIDSLDV